VEQYKDLRNLSHEPEKPWIANQTLLLGDLNNYGLPEQALLAMTALAESAGHEEGMQAVMWIARTRVQFNWGHFGQNYRAQIVAHDRQFAPYNWLHEEGGVALDNFRYAFDPKGYDVRNGTRWTSWYRLAYRWAGTRMTVPYEQMPTNLRRLDSFVSKSYRAEHMEQYGRYETFIGETAFGDDGPADNAFWDRYERRHG
jgi:hypothetical protein